MEIIFRLLKNDAFFPQEISRTFQTYRGQNHSACPASCAFLSRRARLPWHAQKMCAVTIVGAHSRPQSPSFLGHVVGKRGTGRLQIKPSGSGDYSRPQCLRVWECARKLWETLRRSSQNLAIWASQRMLFDPTQTFCFFYICFIAKCCVTSVLERKKFS